MRYLHGFRLLPQPVFILASCLALVHLSALPPAYGQYAPYQQPPNQDQMQQGDGGNDEDSSNEYYTNYTQQAMEAYRTGDTTKAIELMNKAYQLAPQNPAVINNLAACYIKRGVNLQNQRKDYQHALEDYRKAMFYLAYDWPADLPQTPSREENLKILRGNIEGVMKSLKLPMNNWKWHLESARTLRGQGNLQESMVEYALASEFNPKLTEAWVGQGDIYTVRQKPDKASNAYQKAVSVSQNPTDALYIKLGTSQLKNNNPEKAVESFNQALAINPKNQDALLALEQVWKQEIALNPRNMSAHLDLGAVYQQMGRYNDAYAQYQISERLSPNNPLIKLNLGSLYQVEGQLDQAARMYNMVLQQNPNNSQAMLYLADIYKQQGQPQRAEELLQQALQGASDKKQVLDQLVAIAKTEGNPDKIKSTWALYTQTFPQDATVQYQAGLALHEIKDYPDAVEYYKQAIAIQPDMSAAYANLGTALHAMNRDKEAVVALKKAISLDPSLEDLKTLLSAIEQQDMSNTLAEAAKLHEEGKYADAIQGYEKALQEDPDNADIYSRYGLALQALKRYPEALKAYDKAISLDGRNAAYYYYKGTVFDIQNKSDQAIPLYKKALALDPNLKDAQQALDGLQSASDDQQLANALEAYNKKHYTQAMTLIDGTLKSDPNNATAYYYRGLVYDAQKKLNLAQTAYEKAITLDPQQSDAVYALAIDLDTQGRHQDAKKNYERFVSLMKDKPEDDFIKYAKSRIASLGGSSGK